MYVEFPLYVFFYIHTVFYTSEYIGIGILGKLHMLLGGLQEAK